MDLNIYKPSTTKSTEEVSRKKDPLSLLGKYRSKIKQHIRNALDVKDGETVRNNPSFNSEMRNVLHINDYDNIYDEATNKIMESMGKLVQNGSGWNFVRVLKFNIYVMEYHPIRVRSYIPTPSSIFGKHAIVNLQNEDNRCFEYAILAALHLTK